MMRIPLQAMVPVLLLLAGCKGIVTIVQPIDISGTLASGDGHDGPVCLEAYQAWSGEGDLRYPMHRVGRTWVDTPGDYTMSVELPVEDGEGLVLFAWQDRDGDGWHCAPGVDDELSGVTVVSESEVPDVVEADLVMDSACAGATRLFP
jgi:hypothetical protein